MSSTTPSWSTARQQLALDADKDLIQVPLVFWRGSPPTPVAGEAITPNPDAISLLGDAIGYRIGYAILPSNHHATKLLTTCMRRPFLSFHNMEFPNR